MNWFGAIVEGLLTGTAWGLIMETKWGKWVFITLLGACIIGIFVAPQAMLQRTSVELAETVVRIISFVLASQLGQTMHRKWFT